MKVPFLDLKTQYDSIKDEVDSAIRDVISRTAFAGGPFVESFENNFSEFCHSKFAIGVGSGTDALWLALMSLGVGAGDEVITVPNTFIATTEAISYAGAKPVFVDIDKDTLNMDPNLFEAAITSKTKAVIPVHLFGQMAEMDPIISIARKHGLFIIEDACQAHGAEYNGKRAGSLGDAGCFSFYPGKNLGAFGEAGAIVTSNKNIYKTARMLRDHGQNKKYHHSHIGWNCRMDGIQGAVLDVKLKHLEDWTESRIKNAAIYKSHLADTEGIKIPSCMEYSRHVYHLFPVLVENRDSILSSLAENDVYCGIHYPVPLHLTEAYKFLGNGKGSFPVAEKIADMLVSLPMFPELKPDQIEYASGLVKQFVSR